MATVTASAGRRPRASSATRRRASASRAARSRSAATAAAHPDLQRRGRRPGRLRDPRLPQRRRVQPAAPPLRHRRGAWPLRAAPQRQRLRAPLHVCDVAGSKTSSSARPRASRTARPRARARFCLRTTLVAARSTVSAAGSPRAGVCDKGLSKCSPGLPRNRRRSAARRGFGCLHRRQDRQTCVSPDAGDGGADAAPDAPGDTARDVGSDARRSVVLARRRVRPSRHRHGRRVRRSPD